MPLELSVEDPPSLTRTTDFLADYCLPAPENSYLGDGVSGKVRLVVRRSDGQSLALKVQIQSEASLRELDLWRRCLPHPNIMPIVAAYSNILPPESPLLRGCSSVSAAPHAYLLVVMPCMQGGELFHRVLRASLSEDFMLAVMRQLMGAVAHMHRCGVVHGDLKMENILFEHGDSLHIRLCDFGFARLHSDTPLSQYSLYYLSPEIIANMVRAQRSSPPLHFTFSSDVWALGAMLYMLVARTPPFPSLPDEPGHQDGRTITPTISFNVTNGLFSMQAPVWQACNPELRDLIVRMLKPALDARITLPDALLHPWISGVRV